MPQVICFAILLVSLAYDIRLIHIDMINGNGGGNANDFFGDMLSLSSKTDEAALNCRGQRAYIETNKDGEYVEVTMWHTEFVAMAEIYMDSITVDGGVEGFLQDPDPNCILMLDQDLWNQYADVLTGHVMPENGGYIVITKDFY